MRKHFIGLLILSGCGTAGGVQIAGEGVGVSGNGHPELAGVWVNISPHTCQPGPCWGPLWRFDERGRLTALAAGGVGTNLSEMLVDPPGWGITDYAAGETWRTPGPAWGDRDDSTLLCLFVRVVTESVEENIRIQLFSRSTGCAGEFMDFTLSVDGNRLFGEDFILTRPEAVGARIVSFQWRHPADWKDLQCGPDGLLRPFIGSCPQID